MRVKLITIIILIYGQELSTKKLLALVVTILLAGTKGLPGRGKWISGGLPAGLAGAVLVAVFAGVIAGAFAGTGQKLFNAGVQLTGNADTDQPQHEQGGTQPTPGAGDCKLTSLAIEPQTQI